MIQGVPQPSHLISAQLLHRLPLNGDRREKEEVLVRSRPGRQPAARKVPIRGRRVPRMGEVSELHSQRLKKKNTRHWTAWAAAAPLARASHRRRCQPPAPAAAPGVSGRHSAPPASQMPGRGSAVPGSARAPSVLRPFPADPARLAAPGPLAGTPELQRWVPRGKATPQPPGQSPAPDRQAPPLPRAGRTRPAATPEPGLGRGGGWDARCSR